MKPNQLQVLEMLRESNAIEDVYSGVALKKAKEAWDHLLGFNRLTAKNIRETHRILMDGSDLIPEHQGVWRPVQVWVGNHTPPPPAEVDHLMRAWIRIANKLSDPISDHIAFETIHPFVDGNGRMGRILMNWQLVKKNEPLQVYTAAKRWDYYNMLIEAQRT